MPRFIYEAKKGPQELVKGTMEAESQNSAVEKLEQMGYIPIRVIPAAEKPPAQQVSYPEHTQRADILGLFKKVRARDLTILTEQLASLMKSRIPLLEAMNILYGQTENANLKSIISQIASDIKDGRTLSQALNKFPRAFPALYINMIESGEAGGMLDKTLARLADFRNREEEIRGKVVSALAYPVFIVIVGLITIFILFAFVIPRLSSLFAEMGQVLPLPTRILLTLSNNVKSYWLWIIIVVILAVIIFRRVARSEKLIFDGLKLKVPLLGNFSKKSMIATFSRTLGLLIANGIPLFHAIRITSPTLDNEIFRLELEKVHKDLIDGMSLEQSLKRSELFPRFMTNMLAVGERGGNLEEALFEVSNFYEREVDKTTRIITSLLEPVIILLMGLIVGLIVFAMLLPIFQLNLG